MNKIYLDLYSKEEEKKLIKGKNKFVVYLKKIMYIIRNCFKNYKVSKFEKNVGIKIDRDFLNAVCIREKRHYTIEEKRILKFITNYFSQENIISKVKLIYSKELMEKNNCTKYIETFFNNISNLNFKSVNAKNEILEHDFKHISRYMKANKLKADKVRVLVMVSSVSDYNHDKMVQYIEKFKEVDVTVTKKCSRKEILDINKDLDLINNEYGSTIQMQKNKKDFKRYNVYIIFSNIFKRELMASYILNKKALFIDVEQIDLDFLNSGYKLFVKNEMLLKKVFNNINLDINKFSIVLLGEAFK